MALLLQLLGEVLKPLMEAIVHEVFSILTAPDHVDKELVPDLVAVDAVSNDDLVGRFDRVLAAGN